MCTFNSVSGSFGFLSSLSYFSTNFLKNDRFNFNPKELQTFKYIEFIDYTKPIDYSFLVNLNFDSDLMDSDDYGSIGSIRNLCYLGKCVIDFEKKSTYNCSLACLDKIKNCYDGENLCETFECEVYSLSYKNSTCHEFNRIKIWSNTQIKKFTKTFEVSRYSDIIPNNGNCKSGYKKCGIINDDKDYICLKEEYDCPINSIIIKSNNEPPDNDYKSYKFGEKFIFFSNKKINNSLITNFSITSEIDKKVTNYENIDRDYYTNVLKNNPYIYFDSWISKPTIVYLNYIKFQTNFTYKDVIKFQEKYESRIQIYTNDTINELNSQVKKHKNRLSGLGFGALLALVIIGILFFPSFTSKNCNCICCCIVCKDMTPMTRVLLFYIVFSPSIILCIYSFCLTIIKKIDYNELLTKEYIIEYKNFESNGKKRIF